MGDASGPPGHIRAVFVDDGGRRSRWVAWAGRTVAVWAAVWLGLFGASLVGASWVPHLSLPLVGPVLTQRTGGGKINLPPSAAVIPAVNLRDVVPAVVPSASGAGGASRGATSPTRPPTTAVASHPPTSRPTAPGNSGKTRTSILPAPVTVTTRPPGHSGTAPGRTKPHG